MAIIGTAEVLIRADGQKFERQLTTEIDKATRKTTAKVDLELDTRSSLNPIKAFSNLTDNIEGRLSRLGLTTRDVSVLMGAGLAGGVAFAARELFRFGAAAVEAASALNEQRSAADAVLGTYSQLTREFAENAAALGFSEKAALQATNTFAGFFQNVGFSSEAAARLSIGFTALAADLSSLMDVPTEDAIARLISGLRGEQEAIERLNVNISEALVLQKAIALGFGDTTKEIDLQERIVARANLIFEQTTKAQGDLARTSESLANRQRELNAEWENSKARLGEALIPVVNAATQAFTELLNSVNAVFTRIDETDPGEENIFRLFGTGFGFRTKIDDRETNALEKLRDFLLGVSDAGGDAKDTSDELADAFDALNDPTSRVAQAMSALESETDKAADAQRRLDRAVADAKRSEERARRDLNRVLEDAELREDEAERDRLEAIEEAAERRKDAEGDVDDARLQAFRDVRQARERLADFERDSARRVADAEQQVLDLRRQQARAITAALRDVQAAQRAGDAEAENRARIALEEAKNNSDIRQAEIDLAQERADRARDLALLERDLAETRIDARKRVEEAQKRLEQVIRDGNRRIEEAERRLADVRRRNARAVIDAQEKLDDAIRTGKRSVDDARSALRRLDHEVKELTSDVKKLNSELDKLNNYMSDLGSQGGLIGEDIIGVGGFQHGGAARRGQLAIVGEAGPELVRFGGDAHVFPNNQLMSWLLAWLRRGGGPHPLPTGPSPGQLNITNNVFEAADARLTAALVSRYVARQVG